MIKGLEKTDIMWFHRLTKNLINLHDPKYSEIQWLSYQ